MMHVKVICFLLLASTLSVLPGRTLNKIITINNESSYVFIVDDEPIGPKQKKEFIIYPIGKQATMRYQITLMPLNPVKGITSITTDAEKPFCMITLKDANCDDESMIQVHYTYDN